jgi:acetoin utilization deacetylase AcuC-like enzyme
LKTALLIDDRFKEHKTGPGHPERPERLDAIRSGLERAGLMRLLDRVPLEEPADRDIHRVHDPQYLERLVRACQRGAPFIDEPDSAICPLSYEIARTAAGSVIAAVKGVIEGRWKNAFCAVRPPGHHAERDRSMGFCLLNNVAIAAESLIREHGLSRVLILDWDVHHGNATQHSFEERDDVLFVSLHGHPHHVYPGTGFEYETGRGRGEGYTLNVPVLPGAGDAEYRRAFDEKIAPAVERFRPEFVLVSAGFDAHRRDPLAPINLENDSFEWMTWWVLDAAARHCAGRLVSVLEGGYDLTALGECVTLHVEALSGQRSPLSG